MKTVLLVDDEDFFLASLVEGLSPHRRVFEVLAAANGREASWILARRPVDLVITDLKMPEMDGFELLAHMAGAHPHTPVIVMTAFATPQIEERLEGLGVLEHIEKPVDLAALEQRIRRGLLGDELGRIRGVTIAGLLQLLAREEKTCAVTVTSGSKIARLELAMGELVDATTGDLSGAEAAYEIVTWPDGETALFDTIGPPRPIAHSVEGVLLEAARRQDERARALGTPAGMI